MALQLPDYRLINDVNITPMDIAGSIQRGASARQSMLQNKSTWGKIADQEKARQIMSQIGTIGRDAVVEELSQAGLSEYADTMLKQKGDIRTSKETDRELAAEQDLRDWMIMRENKQKELMAAEQAAATAAPVSPQTAPQTAPVSPQAAPAPVQQAAPAQQAAPVGAGATHVIKAGESLPEIAQRNGTTVEAIKKANNLDPLKIPFAGQQLIIPGKSDDFMFNKPGDTFFPGPEQKLNYEPSSKEISNYVPRSDSILSRDDSRWVSSERLPSPKPTDFGKISDFMFNNPGDTFLNRSGENAGYRGKELPASIGPMGPEDRSDALTPYLNTSVEKFNMGKIEEAMKAQEEAKRTAAIASKKAAEAEKAMADAEQSEQDVAVVSKQIADIRDAQRLDRWAAEITDRQTTPQVPAQGSLVKSNPEFAVPLTKEQIVENYNKEYPNRRPAAQAAPEQAMAAPEQAAPVAEQAAPKQVAPQATPIPVPPVAPEQAVAPASQAPSSDAKVIGVNKETGESIYNKYIDMGTDESKPLTSDAMAWRYISRRGPGNPSDFGNLLKLVEPTIRNGRLTASTAKAEDDARKMAMFEQWHPTALELINKRTNDGNVRVTPEIKNDLRTTAPAGLNGYAPFENFLRGLGEKKLTLPVGTGSLVRASAFAHKESNRIYDNKMSAYQGIQANKIAERENPAGVNDAALLEKLVILETGSNSPTDTQIEMYAKSVGWDDTALNLWRKKTVGNFLPPASRLAMYKLADEQAEIQTRSYEQGVKNRVISLSAPEFKPFALPMMPLAGSYTLYRNERHNSQDVRNDPTFKLYTIDNNEDLYGDEPTPEKPPETPKGGIKITPVKKSIVKKNPWEQN